MSSRPRVRQRTGFAGDVPLAGFRQSLLLGNDRQAKLRSALSSGDHVLTLEFSSKLAKGAERLVEMTRQHFSDEEFRCRSAPGEGRLALFLLQIQCFLSGGWIVIESAWLTRSQGGMIDSDRDDQPHPSNACPQQHWW